MSTETFKSKQSDPEAPESLELEGYLQRIVNSLTHGFEMLDQDGAIFKSFSKTFEQSNTLEDVIKAISQLTDIFVKALTTSLKKKDLAGKNEGGLSKREEKDSGESPSQESYDNLEKLLQKYEAEIRDHIRIEQQLKIYSESLEEKVSELENLKADVDIKIEKLESENGKLMKEIGSLKTENTNFEKRIKQFKSKDVGCSQPRHSKSNSIESVTLLELHEHSAAERRAQRGQARGLQRLPVPEPATR